MVHVAVGNGNRKKKQKTPKESEGSAIKARINGVPKVVGTCEILRVRLFDDWVNMVYRSAMLMSSRFQIVDHPSRGSSLL